MNSTIEGCVLQLVPFHFYITKKIIKIGEPFFFFHRKGLKKAFSKLIYSLHLLAVVNIQV